MSQLVSLCCPVCNGAIPLEDLEKDVFVCIYCNSTLEYKKDKIIGQGEKKELSKLRPEKKTAHLDFTRIQFDGVVIVKTNETKYKGCPACYKKEGLCSHSNEPINLYWREYLVSTEEDERKILCSPRIKELGLMTLHQFDSLVKGNDDIYRITAVDDQAQKREILEEKIQRARERIWTIKKR